MKVIMPIAGKGTRLLPHTAFVPKPLMRVAGKPILEHVLADVAKLHPEEILFTVGYKHDMIRDYVAKEHPELQCSYVEQTVRDGDGSAVRLALDNIITDSELYVVFGADTLIDFNLKGAIDKQKYLESDAGIFAMEVEDPENYGVLNVRDNDEIFEIEEKPDNPKSNLAIIGAYYFKSALKVKSLLNEFYANKKTLKGEYRLAQVLQSFLDEGLSVRPSRVDKWFDCGRKEVLLEANKHFLEKSHGNGRIEHRGDSTIIHPCYVPKSVNLERCIIGPHVSVGENTKLKNVIAQNDIIGAYGNISNIVLEESLIGDEVDIDRNPKRVNIPDKTQIGF